MIGRIVLGWAISLVVLVSAAPSFAQYYSYAPAIVRDGGGTYMFTCENEEPGKIQDFIFVRRLIGSQPGGRRAVALSPSTDKTRFDAFHVCDPEIVAGRFSYAGKPYRYALLYTGNDKPTAFGNALGIAYAESIEGPWVPADRPLVDYAQRADSPKLWGVGQPAAVNLDGGATILLAYTRGAGKKTDTIVRRVTLDGTQQTIMESLGDEAGAVPDMPPAIVLKAGREEMHNIAIAFDQRRNRLVVVQPTRRAQTDEPKFIEAGQTVGTISLDSLLSGTPKWEQRLDLTETETGKARNHNAGILRLPDGSLPPIGPIEVYVTSADRCLSATQCFPKVLWGYRPFEVSIDATNWRILRR